MSTNAGDMLSDLSTQVDVVNQQFAQAASDIATSMQASIGQSEAAVGLLSDSFQNAATNAITIMGPIDDISRGLTTMSDTYGTINDIVDEHQEAVAGVSEDYQAWNDIIDNMLGDFMDVDALFDTMIAGAGTLGDIINDIGSGAGLSILLLAITGLSDAFDQLMADEERFITVNYRLYGSTYDIIEMVNDATVEYGLLRGVAIEAMEALAGSTRIPQEELGGYVAMLAMVNRVTGMSIAGMTDLTRAMNLAGFELGDIEYRLSSYASMMREAGASTTEVEAIMRKQTQNMVNDSVLFGQAATKAMQDHEVAMTAMLRQTGMAADAYVNLTTSARSSIDNIALSTSRGSIMAAELIANGYATQEFVDSMTQGQLTQLGAYRSALEVVEDMQNISDPLALSAKIDSVAASGGVAVDSLKEVALALQEMQEQGKDIYNPIDLGTMTQASNEMAKMEAAYNESIGNIMGIYNTLVDSVRSSYMNAVITIVPFIQTVLNTIGEPLKNFFSSVARLSEPILAFASLVGTVFMSVVSPIFYFVSGIVDGLADAFEPFTGIFRGLTSWMTELGSSLGSVNNVAFQLGSWIGYIGSLFIPFGSWIGGAIGLLARFGGGIANVIQFLGTFGRMSTVFSTMGSMFAWVPNVMGWFGGLLSAIGGGFSRMAGVVMGAFNLISPWFGWLRSATIGIVNAVYYMGDQLLGTTGIWETIGTFLTDWLLDPLKAGAELIGGVGDWISSWFTSADNAVQGASDTTAKATNAIQQQKEVIIADVASGVSADMNIDIDPIVTVANDITQVVSNDINDQTVSASLALKSTIMLPDGFHDEIVAQVQQVIGEDPIVTSVPIKLQVVGMDASLEDIAASMPSVQNRISAIYGDIGETTRMNADRLQSSMADALSSIRPELSAMRAAGLDPEDLENVGSRNASRPQAINSALVDSNVSIGIPTEDYRKKQNELLASIDGSLRSLVDGDMIDLTSVLAALGEIANKEDSQPKMVSTLSDWRSA